MLLPPHYTTTTKSRWSVEGEIMIHEEELSASRSHSRQKVKYLMEYLGSNYVDVVDKTFANAPPVM